ncbi:MAG TPA: hypothetical protein PKC69_10765 [Chitinophagaceae bacterium]|nr:hypothetical protein [Chitinophagaceae bacterium]
MAVWLLAATTLLACNNKDNKPDTSGIKVDLQFKRFDQDFFSLDTNNLQQGLAALSGQYPELTGIFLQNILGAEPYAAAENSRLYLRMSAAIRDTINDVFKSTAELEKDFTAAFKIVKYYFPDYKVPAIYTVAGPMDALAQGAYGPEPNFLRPDFAGISLQFYLGRDFSIYHDEYFVNNVVPLYRSRRFSKEYIVPDVMKLVAENLFPDNSKARPLIEQMIERGKQWWLLDKFLPDTHDSLKTGYTTRQLTWCRENEGLIWAHIVKTENLYATDPFTLQNYLGEAPFTQGFSQEFSPGNLGSWIGWQIVKKYADKNSSSAVKEIMEAAPGHILEAAKYKPK